MDGGDLVCDHCGGTAVCKLCGGDDFFDATPSIPSAIKNAVSDSLARNLSLLTVTMVSVANGHKTEMVDLHEVRAMHEATANNLAMTIAELVRRNG